MKTAGKTPTYLCMHYSKYCTNQKRSHKMKTLHVYNEIYYAR